MEQGKSGLKISFIDKERRAAYLEYEGCSITLNFAREPNTELKGIMKDVLIGSMLHTPTDSHNCLSA